MSDNKKVNQFRPKLGIFVDDANLFYAQKQTPSDKSDGALLLDSIISKADTLSSKKEVS